MNDIEKISQVPIIIWVVIVLFLLVQGSWIFYDASRRGENKWLWGFFGLLNVPSSIIIYLIVTRRILKTKNCTECRKNIKEDAIYCPYCGKKVD